MSTLNDNREITILESKGIQIKNHHYHIVLTSRRIIFDSASDNLYRSVPLSFIRGIEPGMDYSGDPVLSVTMLSASGEIKKIILRFAKSDFHDPLRTRSRWYTEIRKRIHPHNQVSPVQTPIPVTPAPAFCTKCGKKLVENSVFCDRCGAKVPFPVQSMPPEQHDEIVREPDIIPEHSSEYRRLPQQGRSVLYTNVPATKKIFSITSSQPKEQWKKKWFSPGFLKKRSTHIIAAGLAAVIIAATVFLTVFPAGIPGFNLPFPDINGTPTDISVADVTLRSERNTPANTETSSLPAEQEEPAQSEAPGSGLAPMVAMGDPGAVLSAYPSLFNNGDGPGLRELLSENMKSHYTLDSLDTELTAARSDDYAIERIHVRDQVIEEDSAVLDADVYWMTPRSSTTSSLKLFLVFEDNRWKLDSLILHP
jgi:hypothetical protein